MLLKIFVATHNLDVHRGSMSWWEVLKDPESYGLPIILFISFCVFGAIYAIASNNDDE